MTERICPQQGPDRARLGHMKQLFYPQGIAVAGASRDPSKIGSLWAQSLISAGCKAAVYAINPAGGEIDGRPIYSSLRHTPGPVDLVISCIPREQVMSLLDDCAAKGVIAVYFYTAGFRETGKDEWAGFEHAVVERAKKGGFRIIGPNCFGVYCPEHGIPYGPFQLITAHGSAGLVCQSSGNMGKILEYGLENWVGFSKGVSIGNAADLEAGDFLEYLAADSKTRTIAMYLEGTRNPRGLFDALKMAASRKPVIVWKGGSSSAGARAASSHTGALGAEAGVWSGAVKQAGALEVGNLEELCDTLLLMDKVGPLPGGAGLGAVCGVTDGGGGEAVLISDLCAADGIDVPGLAPGAERELDDLVGRVGSVLCNPVDLSQKQRSAAVLDRVLCLLAEQGDIDMVMVYLNAGVILERFPADVIQSITQVLAGFRRRNGKPLVVVMPPGRAKCREGVHEALSMQGVPVLPGMQRAARALRNLMVYTLRRSA